MRRSFPAYPVMPLQPSAAYYATRNLATLLEGLRGSDGQVELTGDAAGVECHLLESADRLVVALWLSGRGQDESDRKKINLRVAGRYSRVTAADALNGTRQHLAAGEMENSTIIEGLLVTDYAVLIELWQ